MITIWVILQVFIVAVETFVRLKVTHPRRRHRKIGYAVAIGAQFLWLAIFLHFHQYYLLPLLVLDGGIWARGLWKANHYQHKVDDTLVSI